MKNNRKIDLDKEAQFYNGTASIYAERRKLDFIWEIPESLLLLKQKYFVPNCTIVDMGCGPAISIKNIIPVATIKKCNYIGVDISKELLKIASINISTGKFVNDDISTVKFPKNFADVIISLGALHHVEDKILTLNHWLSILKIGGLILLREPTYGVLKKGEGESPNEEGIKTEELINFIKSNNLKIVSYIYFSTPAFHFFNRVMIKFGLKKWQKNRKLWYPVVIIDVIIGKLFSRVSHLFKGEAFVMTLKKI